ncbi:MAG: phosphoribosylformylglycinamidine cyclo-ligase [Chthonomonadales bacterium]
MTEPSSSPKTSISYADSGVNIDVMNRSLQQMKDSIKSTYTKGVLSGLGSFGGIFGLDLEEFANPALVASIDGVGTKLKIAQMMDKHDTVGGDLVNHCVNDILVQGAKPLFFLDYFSTGVLKQKTLVSLIEGVAQACRETGTALLGGETAEMPGMYADGEYDVAGTIVGVVDKNRVIDGSTIQPGDAVIGLESDGLHTNGYSLARKALLEVGGLKLTDTPAELGGESLGKALLSRHRCYANAILPLLSKFDVRGMAHLTGGGFYDNIPRILPESCGVRVDGSCWSVPPLFQLIQQCGGVDDREMYRTFNMGIGMVVIVPKPSAEAFLSALTEAGERVHLIGKVVGGEHEVEII